MAAELGRTGIWSSGLRYGDTEAATTAARAAESLGAGCVWIPDIGGTDILDRVEELLAATSTLCVATGILNLWLHEPARVAERVAGCLLYTSPSPRDS